MEFLLVAATKTKGERRTGKESLVFTQTFNKEEDPGPSALGINDGNQGPTGDARMCLGN